MVSTGAVEAILPFILTRNLGTTALEVRVRYQACTDHECLAPASVSTQIARVGMDLIRD
jgi:hypothetical protein